MKKIILLYVSLVFLCFSSNAFSVDYDESTPCYKACEKQRMDCRHACEKKHSDEMEKNNFTGVNTCRNTCDPTFNKRCIVKCPALLKEVVAHSTHSQPTVLSVVDWK